MDNGKWEATDLRGQEFFHFEKIPRLPYDPNEYMVFETNAKAAAKKMKKLSKVPTQQEYAEQRKLLEGEQHSNWVKFNTQVKKHLETEVMLHQVSNVIQLGWKPAIESKPRL